MPWYLFDSVPETGPGAQDRPGVAPYHGPTLSLERVRLPPVQQGVDDHLSLPLHCVIETIPATVVLNGGVTAG